MTYYYSNISSKRLNECCHDLQILFNAVIKEYDCSILEGHRDKDTQNRYFEEKKSKVVWPLSLHNNEPSQAIDVAPYPIDWSDDAKNIRRYYALAYYAKGIAFMLKQNRMILHNIRWGGDWDSDNDFTDQSFNDLVHFEIIQVK